MMMELGRGLFNPIYFSVRLCICVDCMKRNGRAEDDQRSFSLSLTTKPTHSDPVYRSMELCISSLAPVCHTF